MKVKIRVTAARISLFEPDDMFVPRKAHDDDAGYDIVAACVEPVCIEPGQTVLVPAGFRMELEQGYEAQIRSRSGNALKKGLQVANAPGTIDAGYRGEVGVILFNSSNDPLCVARGDKIAQMVFAKLPDIEIEVLDEELSESSRGEGGFGSTGM